MKELIIGYKEHKPGEPDPLWTAWEQTGELIRCKDCKYNNPFGCMKLQIIVGDDWFCADGERNE